MNVVLLFSLAETDVVVEKEVVEAMDEKEFAFRSG
tara:strand:- start:85 stop:189 length:105 start_codon:yes stop_codon:yes gene_type:complete